MTFTLTAALLLATLVAGPEQPVSVARQGIAASSFDSSTISATNGETMLLVWHDTRGSQAAFFNAAGQRLHANAIALPIRAAAAFWNGEEWVVLNFRQYVRLDRDGTLLDRIPHALPITLGEFPMLMKAVWAGAAAVIVIGDAESGELVAWTLDREMNLTARTFIALFIVDRQLSEAIALGADGSSALLVMQDLVTNEFRASRFDRFGVLESTNVVHATRSHAGKLAIGSDGELYFVVYGSGYPQKTYAGFTIDRFVGSDPLPQFSIGPQYSESSLAPHILFDGTAMTAYAGVLSGDRMQVMTVRIGRNRALLAGPAPLFAYDTMGRDSFHAQSAGGTAAVVYGERISAVAGVARARIGGSVVDLATGPFQQTIPIAASAAMQSLVAWAEEYSLLVQPAVYATRVDTRGQVVDPQSILLGGGLCADTRIDAASDGRDFLVVWQEPQAISGSLVRADGTAVPLRIFDKGLIGTCLDTNVRVASNGSLYLVAWSVPGADEGDRDLRAVRVAGDGTVLDAEPIALAEQAPGRIVSDGRDFLVTAGREVVRITADGTVLDPAGIRLGGNAMTAWWNGTTYVVAVAADDNQRAFRLRRIGSDGSGGAVFGELLPDLHPYPERISPFNSGAFRCDARGCLFPLISNVIGQYVLRIEDHVDRFTTEFEPFETAAAPRGDGVPENLNLATGFVAYNRITLDAGNSSRVYVRPLYSGGRGRAVRH